MAMSLPAPPLCLDDVAWIVGDSGYSDEAAQCLYLSRDTYTDPRLLGSLTNHRFGDGWRTPLMRASFVNDLNRINMLLACGSDVDGMDSKGYTPLHWACKGGHLAAAQALFDRGGAVNRKRRWHGSMPLHVACEAGHASMVSWLLDCGAKIEAMDPYCKTALQLVCARGHAPLVPLLLDRGADIEAEDMCCMTPLLIACYSGHEPAARALLDRGANVAACSNCSSSPLHLACENPGKAALVQLLLERGAMIEATDMHGCTPLHKACRCGFTDAAKLLLEHGAAVDAEDHSGMTALRLARSGAIENLLLGHGAQW